jgi:predicted transcriptional regulator
MSKAVMISIRPKWCEKIARGEKTVEVRKTRPKLETPFKCYIYCTQASVRYQTICGCHVLNSDELYRHPEQGIKYGDSIELMLCENYTKDNFLNGKVIGEFTCDRIYELETRSPGGSYYVKGEGQPTTNDVARQSCLTLKDMHEYLQSKVGYGWHISNLKIYDTPKELSKFSRPFENCIDKVCDEFGCALCENGGHIKRAPQSWCYVEEQK